MISLFMLAALFASQAPQQQPDPSRIIVFILDDVGSDSLAQIATPNIDALAAGGVQFTRAYSHAWCKPSRDSLLRGSFQGVIRGEPCAPIDSTALTTNQPNFVAALRERGYLTGLVGKWHLGHAGSRGLSWWFSPHAAGFDHWWSGTSASAIGNCNPGGVNAFDDGIFFNSMMVNTVRQRDRLFDLMDEADITGKPLFAWVGFTDAHSPWIAPPSSILPMGYSIPSNPTQRDLFEAEVVSLDFVIGQVVAALPPDAWVIVMSENGTPKEVTVPQTDRAKLTVYERGVHVPFIVNGPGLAPGVIDTPIALYDFGASLLTGMGISGPMADGQDIFSKDPWGAFVFVENPSPGANHSRAVIEARWKLIQNDAGYEFYDLSNDPDELNPLLNSGVDFDRLEGLLGNLPGFD